MAFCEKNALKRTGWLSAEPSAGVRPQSLAVTGVKWVFSWHTPSSAPRSSQQPKFLHQVIKHLKKRFVWSQLLPKHETEFLTHPLERSITAVCMSGNIFNKNKNSHCGNGFHNHRACEPPLGVTGQVHAFVQGLQAVLRRPFQQDGRTPALSTSTEAPAAQDEGERLLPCLAPTDTHGVFYERPASSAGVCPFHSRCQKRALLV